jgi:hypothetical protein
MNTAVASSSWESNTWRPARSRLQNWRNINDIEIFKLFPVAGLHSLQWGSAFRGVLSRLFTTEAGYTLADKQLKCEPFES